MRDVVITGFGPVTPIGIGNDAFAASLREGRSAVAEVTGFDIEGCRHTSAAEIIDFTVSPFLKTEKNYLDRNSEFAFAASRLAFDQAELEIPDGDANRVGLCLGTAYGNLESMLTFFQQLTEKGPKLVSPFIFPHTYNNTTASLLTIEYGLKGVHANFSSGDAAGGEAFAYAFDCIGSNRADVILAGGVDVLSEPVFRLLDRRHPKHAPGEGAGMLVLESAEHAAERGVPALARIVSCALARDQETARQTAMAQAELGAEEIKLVIDTSAVPVEFAGGAGLFDLQRLAGHTLGASMPIGLIAAALMLGPNDAALVSVADPSTLSIVVVLRGGPR